MDLFFRVFRHVLPRSRAWSLVVEKTLRNFFEGLTGLPADFQSFIDQVWRDIFPSTTRELDAWEDQFGVLVPPPTDTERREALSAAWQRGGGQGPDTLQDVLQGAGFPLFVHDPWYFAPGKTLRNPNLYLADGDTTVVYVVECGNPLAQCGEPTAQAGDTSTPAGILLVNKILIRNVLYVPAVSCGEVSAQCGEPAAQCGDNTGFSSGLKPYLIPTDPTLWAYFWYIGGETFGDSVSIPITRKDELETLILKIGPAHTWAGLLVTY